MHAYALVESVGRCVSFPDIKSYIVTPSEAGVLAHVVEQRFTYVSAALRLVDTQIVDIQRAHILQQPVVIHGHYAAERIPHDLRIGINEHRRVIVSQKHSQLRFTVLGSMRFEQVGTQAVVHPVHLVQQFNQARYIRCGSATNHSYTGRIIP